MTDQTDQRRVIPITAKISLAEERALDALRAHLGSTDMPWTVSNVLRHAIKLACQQNAIDWPAVDS
jgi:hypothetical protein